MLGKIRISLADKCQLLFGAAVLLILSAALAVVGLRMQALTRSVPRQEARAIAEAWLAGQIELKEAFDVTGPQPARFPQLELIPRHEFSGRIETDVFLADAITLFETAPDTRDYAQDAIGGDGEPLYRYARAIRRTDAEQRPALLEEVDPEVAGVTPLANPLDMVLLIHLDDASLARDQLVNRIYIIIAGLFAGLLAIAVFWYITTRIILSPVRVLRDYASKVSEGDLNIRSDINTGDEFEQLSDMFNTMLENLKSNADELRSANKTLDLKLVELAESNVSLFEANKLKGEFLANVSHEFRTPLNSIIGFAEVLEETLKDRTGPVDEKRKRYIGNIITSSRQLLTLINDLLDLAKIEAGRLELHMGPVSLADTSEGLMNLIRPQAEKGEVSLELRLEPKLPVVETDAGKVQQVLFNFLANAVKFTPPCGTVTMSATREREPTDTMPGWVRLSVSDTGPGIAPEHHDSIFDKFFQLDPSATREQAGTGLGLTISKELTELLGGRIELDSDLGKGATFSLIIPDEPVDLTAPLMGEASDTEPAAPLSNA